MKTFSPDHAFKNLYGGSTPDPKSVRRWFKSAGLTLPINIMAIELEDHDPDSLKITSSKLNTWVVDSDKGMLYVMYNGSPEKMEQLCCQKSLLHGESFTCETEDQWIAVLRKAIKSVRQHYLSRLSGTSPKQFSLANELEQRVIALNTFQNETDWKESVGLWLNIILNRHQKNLSNLRRKWVEFLNLATADVDSNDNMSFVYIQALRQILNTYAFSDFHEVFPQILNDLRPYLILNRAQHVLLRHGYPEPLEKALTIIRESYTSPISVSEISAKCFVTREHLSRLFKQETGYTITEFLQRLRVGHAKQLLTETNTGILEIALDSGFSTVEHFHRTFKKHTNLTPHRYRKTH